MSTYAAKTGNEAPLVPSSPRAAARELSGYWWTWLVAGVAWVTISCVILQFDDASVTTVGVLVGMLFAFASVQNLAIAMWPDTSLSAVPTSARLVSGIFSGLFAVSAVICFVEPESTFAGLADMLGFLFLIVGIWWMVRAFMERPVNPLWWLTLISGVLMTILAFWTSGQFFIEKAYVLLVFAGIWALMEGISNIVRAFAVRQVHEGL
jgi:uncharacterized membrane protein HdeD (DUF308 family)